MSLIEGSHKTLRDAFSLNSDRASNEEIKERIASGGRVRGTNMCILILAIFIASIGLNMNSTAVIIGAMLISPLMGGIMSMGFGLATSDLTHFKNALMSFLFQVSVSIITSTIYFLISPIRTVSSELLSRTTPTIWDVLIAIFGGLAGIIAITRKDRVTNVVPGVAIATALMPPLCTAGYGLATGNWRFLLGAFYLFFINTFFICITSIIVLRFLRVASRSYASKKLTTHVRIGIAAIAFITILPSIYLGWEIVRQNLAQSHYKQFMESRFSFPSTQVVRSDYNTQNRTISVAVIGTTLQEAEIKSLEDSLVDFGLSGVKLNVTQTEVKQGVTQEQLEALLNQEKADDEANNQQFTDLQNKLNEASDLLDLRTRLDTLLSQVSSELLLLCPKATSAGAATMVSQDGETISAVVVTTSAPLTEEEKLTLTEWLNARIGTETLLVEAHEPVPEETLPVDGETDGETAPDAEGTAASEPTESEAL